MLKIFFLTKANKTLFVQFCISLISYFVKLADCSSRKVNTSFAEVYQCRHWPHLAPCVCVLAGTDERDMIIMRHDVGVQWPDRSEEVKHIDLVVYGDAKKYSAMAATVGFPTGIAAKMVLDGKFRSALVLCFSSWGLAFAIGCTVKTICIKTFVCRFSYVYLSIQSAALVKVIRVSITSVQISCTLLL